MTHTAHQPPERSLAHVREKLVQALSLAPEGSASHTVEAHGDGLRVTLARTDGRPPVYAYALPWARGWSVFVTDDPDAHTFDWQHATGYSCSIPNDRNITGPENINVKRLSERYVDAIEYMEYHFGTHDHVNKTTNDDYESYSIEGEIIHDDGDYFEGEDGDATDVVFYGQP